MRIMDLAWDIWIDERILYSQNYLTTEVVPGILQLGGEIMCLLRCACVKRLSVLNFLGGESSDTSTAKVTGIFRNYFSLLAQRAAETSMFQAAATGIFASLITNKP